MQKAETYERSGHNWRECRSSSPEKKKALRNDEKMGWKMKLEPSNSFTTLRIQARTGACLLSLSKKRKLKRL